MCGIVALIGAVESTGGGVFDTMTNSLAHRGPDDRGVAWLPDEDVALGMRRLSIVDLEGGHQPMWDEHSRHGVVFNGEIYNAAGLRAELLRHGHTFRTNHSDTEVLVHGYEEWGLDLFRKLDGMFAFAIWDRPNRQLIVARDRVGEKPLYIGTIPGGYAIASELKALLAHPLLERCMDFAAFEQYLAFDYVIAPRTILKSVQKLPAGNYAIITPESCEMAAYWSIAPAEKVADEGSLVEELDALLDQSVRDRLVSDVPLGLFLSGGLDSTTVGYYMRKYATDLHSFSIGFGEAEFDESSYAQLAANRLETVHHSEILSRDSVLELVPRVAELLDEPMADQSIFPTYLLSSFARRWVKVALGGDGSDELLMGYRTYMATSFAEKLQAFPAFGRSAVASIARGLPNGSGLHLKGKRFAELLDKSPTVRLLSFLGAYGGNARWVLTAECRHALAADMFAEPVKRLSVGLPSDVSLSGQTMATYVRGYLQEDILTKVDRASMAASLEVRSPFLSPALIDFLTGIHPSYKLRGTTGKHLLRRLMKGRIPDEIIYRKKHGFGVPLSAWMRTTLSPLVRDMLSPSRVGQGGMLEPSVVQTLVEEHLGNRRDHGKLLWPLLLFELWREKWL